MKLPLSFQVRPFYYEKSSIFEPTHEEQQWLDVYFYWDLQEQQKPWQNPTQSLEKIFSYWEKNHYLMKEYFNKRENEQAKQLMLSMSALIIQGVFWLNRQRVTSLKDLGSQINKLPNRPVNAEERIPYILEHLDHFQSFKQLEMLFSELKKLLIRVSLLEKKEKKKE
ncbi:YpoC family protein [Alkalihalobacillus pseudalcaliphilus]|uniref:YpoC family protein n=1 Tax=Alkalihalobacillus pseudalcaliphilus TaxID=79884 RepID=UPI00064D987D|nr:hypothetical protein [Alkalihalobacillus pseudalcaliphilus]KMK76403.1 hypothetical protein AB990_14525 [Alkalihalobacillus pseudalcaliphilus]